MSNLIKAALESGRLEIVTVGREPPEPGSMEDVFGPVIDGYSRAQAIEDGVLVDVSKAIEPCPFKYPVAMTRAAYAECIEAGGTWEHEPWPDGFKREDGTSGDEVLKLPGCQDVTGRLWDVFNMAIMASKAQRAPTDRVHFQVSVWLPPVTPKEIEADGKRKTVKLWSMCGPGDNAEPVITIMLEGED